jgi:hypothetical protein
MKLEIEVNDQVVKALDILHQFTGLSLEECAVRSIVQGIQAVQHEIAFHKARKINNETTTKALQ